MGILDRFNIGKQIQAIKPWFENRKMANESPKPPRAGHKYIPNTQVQAPLGSKHLPEGIRGRAVQKPAQQESAPLTTPTASPSPLPSKIGYGRSPKTQGTVPQESVTSAIQAASEKFGVPADLLYDIAFSESSYDPTKVNMTPEGQEAGNPTGLFQFTDDTWADVMSRYAGDEQSSIYGVLPNDDRLDPNTNALMAAYLMKFGQLGKWDASEWNWGEYYDLAKELEDEGYYLQSQYHEEGKRPSVRLQEAKAAREAREAEEALRATGEEV